MPDRRPDPDQLLARIKQADAREHAGRLKIFFGAAPGVGKTFAMLRAARLRAATGSAVVIGVVETHGRDETRNLTEGFEEIPLRTLEYRGTALPEFDLDRALVRHPDLLLVDELAHTNAPGSRHAKRWQDVEELLTAGIDVYTTLNVQHIESLNDVVAQITGVVVRETVPDKILGRADEIELVDVSPEVLIQRLKEGKVYVPATAERALEHFFRKGNLLALRELALRRTADRVDAQVRDYRQNFGIREPWAAVERILVALGPDASATPLVRAARRMAEPSGAEWFAVTVEPSGQEPSPLAADALRLAESLGGTAVRLVGASVADELLAWAAEHNITRLVVGRPARRGWWERFRGSLPETLVVRDPGIEISVITGTPDERPAAVRTRPRSAPPAYGLVLGVIAAATALGFGLRQILSTADIAMLYLLGVVIVGARSRTRPAIAAAILSIALFDFIFVPPYYTFAVSDASYILTFAMMLGIGIVAARLTGRIREDADRLRQRERETAAAYALSRDISRAGDIAGIEAATRKHLEWAVAGTVDIFLPGQANHLPESDPVAVWVLENGKPAGPGTDTLPRQDGLYLPLATTGRPMGVVRITRPAAAELMDAVHRPLVEALVAQAALGIERVILGARNETSRIEVEAERLRTSLLSSLSHDLRTPLASIEGAASSLLDDSVKPDRVQAELAQTILDESRRMDRLVGNLLEMVRVQSGSLAVQKEWQPLEEVIGIALLRLDDRLTDFTVTVDLPATVPLVPMDGLLIEQVLINLIENAAKYARGGGAIGVTATEQDGSVVVSVADRGPGVPAAERERIFDKFYRIGSGGGIGLGLAICRGIVLAHGGRIWADAREGGGAIFRFSLPLEGAAPALPAEEII